MSPRTPQGSDERRFCPTDLGLPDWFVRRSVPTPRPKALARDCTVHWVPLLAPSIGSRLAQCSLCPSGCVTAWGVCRPAEAFVHMLPPFCTVSLPLVRYGLRSVPSSFSPKRDMPSTHFVPAFADLLLVWFLVDRSS